MSDPILPPYVLWRNGRPRFHPSSREVALGFAGRDLKNRDGSWMNFEQASAEGWPLFEQILDCRGFDQTQVAAIVAAHRAGAKIPRMKPAKRKHKLGAKAAAVEILPPSRSVEALLTDWLAALKDEINPAVKVADATLESYRKAADAVINKPRSRAEAKQHRERVAAAELLGLEVPERDKEEFALSDVDDIDRIAVNEFFKALCKERGIHMAHGAIAAFSAAWTWGTLSRKWRLGPNPRHGLDLPRPEGRIIIYSDIEIRALITAALHIKCGPNGMFNRRSIATSIVLGVLTSQRQTDRLLLKDEGLTDGRRMIRQKKTRKLVPVKETAMLAEHLEASRKHNAAIALAFGQTPDQRPDTILVNEATGAPYTDNEYRNAFEAVRKLALEGVYDVAASELARLQMRNDWQRWISPPCPSLLHHYVNPETGELTGETTLKQDRDLRDTGVTWLARAGCTMAEICAITGHSPASVETIIRHYLGAYRELADAGIDKLTVWMAQEGIAV